MGKGKSRRMLLKSVGKGGRRLLKSLLERSKLVNIFFTFSYCFFFRSKLGYLKVGWDRSGANMLAAGLEKVERLGHLSVLFWPHQPIVQKLFL